MRLLVCGGRDFADFNQVRTGLITREQFDKERYFVFECISKAINWESTDDIDTWLPPAGTVIISGGADGVDTVAIDFAVIHWTEFEDYPADWKTHGRAAGPIRNQQMLDHGKPDKVLAINGGKGTADMVRRAKKAGVPVIEVRYAPD